MILDITGARRARPPLEAAFLLALSLMWAGTSWAEVDRFRRADERVVDRIVAIVGGAGDRGTDLHIVTLVELDLEARLLAAERAREVHTAATIEVTPGLRESVLQGIVNQLLLVAEAERLELTTVGPEDVAEERGNLADRLGGPDRIELFQRLTSAPRELVDTMLRRRIIATRFIQRNIQLVTPVSEQEVETLFRSGQHPFGDRPLEEIRDALESMLVARHQQERLADWLADARRRSRVRLPPPPENAPSAATGRENPGQSNPSRQGVNRID